MVYKAMNRLRILIFPIAIIILLSICILTPNSYAIAASQSPKAIVTLNIQRGPLGVLLTIRGKNFHTGLANVSYRDAQNTAGSFGGPVGSSVQVAHDGTFVATNELFPASGPAGTWKVVVVDSKGTTATASYQVLTAPGQSAGAPSLIVNPGSGKPGDVIAFTGSNWLPQGTSVSVRLLDGSGGSLVSAQLSSDKNGAIMGAFRLPQTFAPAQTTATILATDTTGALQAQIQMGILLPTPPPAPTPTIMATPVPKSSASTQSGPSDTTPTGLSFFTNSVLGVVFLLVGAILCIAAVMSVLFLVPWGRQRGRRESYVVINSRLHKLAPYQVTLPATPVRIPSLLEQDYYSGVTQPYPSPLAPVDVSEQETAEWTLRES